MSTREDSGFARDGEFELPEGVSPAQWALERVRHQDPRIKAFLGCIQLLNEVLVTDYQLLHCSPARLRKTWQQMQDISQVLRSRLASALDGPSSVPELEAARRHAEMALGLLDANLLEKFGELPEKPSDVVLLELRKHLCSAMGQLKDFLHETFGRIVAADPRAMHQAEYYLSRRLPGDIQESQWLHESVTALAEHLRELDAHRQKIVVSAIEKLWKDREFPSQEEWAEVSVFLVGLYNDLTARLKEIICLQGTRFEEMNALKGYSVEIPAKCLKVFEIHELSGEILNAFDPSSPSEASARRECQSVVCRRLGRLLADLDHTVRDLIAFVPLWLYNIERRRAFAIKTLAEASKGDRHRRGSEPLDQPAVQAPAEPPAQTLSN